MFLKIFLAAITVCSLLGCLGANRNGCMKKAIILSAKGKCLSAELETAAEAAAQAAQGAAERVLEYGA